MVQREEQWIALERRISKVEGQNRKFRIILCALALAHFSIVTLALVPSGNSIRAQQFILTNSKGESRAKLTTIGDEFPTLTLTNPDGKKSTEVSPLGIAIADTDLPGKIPSTYLGDTGLYFTDGRGQVLIELGGASTERPQLAPSSEMKMFDTSGKLLWRAP